MLKPLGDRVVLKVEEKEQTVGGFVLAGASKADTKTAEVVAVGERSEERRVGKECRSRGSPYH